LLAKYIKSDRHGKMSSRIIVYDIGRVKRDTVYACIMMTIDTYMMFFVITFLTSRCV